MMARHCWQDGPKTSDDRGTTCLLPDGHAGPHEFTRDDEITVRIEPISASAPEGKP